MSYSTVLKLTDTLNPKRVVGQEYLHDRANIN